MHFLRRDWSFLTRRNPWSMPIALTNHQMIEEVDRHSEPVRMISDSAFSPPNVRASYNR